MPAVTPQSSETKRVLVSGANGYIAAWVVKTLLEQGYTVRGTVRSEQKAKDLEDYFGKHNSKTEWVVVEDITKDGAFDEVVKDVVAIQHLASPVSLSIVDPEAFIGPAVKGTVGILQSALKFGTKVKRIVLTSSVGAIEGTVAESEHRVTFDENNWSDDFVKALKEDGKINSQTMYYTSKNLSEKAAWDFYNKNKTEIAWDLVVLNPSLVLGSGPLLDVKDLASLPNSLLYWHYFVSADQPNNSLKATYGYVDIKDVADAHVEALKKEAAGGERIIISSGMTTWQESRNLIFSSNPELCAANNLPRGNPALPYHIAYEFSNEKGKRILGTTYKSLEETVSSMLVSFETKGWLMT